MTNVIQIVNSSGFVTTIETDADFITINGTRVNISEATASPNRVNISFCDTNAIGMISFVKAVREATQCSLGDGKAVFTSLVTNRRISVDCRNNDAAKAFAATLRGMGLLATNI
jgi:hypothetical protein